METFSVPVVGAASPDGPDDFVVASVDHLLTVLCRAAPALLHAEWAPEPGEARWLLRDRSAVTGPDVEVGVSRSGSAFRALLARLGHHYMGGQLYGGYQIARLEQAGRAFKGIFFLSNLAQSGFWVRVYASPEQTGKSDTGEPFAVWPDRASPPPRE